jgi:hypothetical protein
VRHSGLFHSSFVNLTGRRRPVDTRKNREGSAGRYYASFDTMLEVSDGDDASSLQGRSMLTEPLEMRRFHFRASHVSTIPCRDPGMRSCPPLDSLIISEIWSEEIAREARISRRPKIIPLAFSRRKKTRDCRKAPHKCSKVSRERLFKVHQQSCEMQAKISRLCEGDS